MAPLRCRETPSRSPYKVIVGVVALQRNTVHNTDSGLYVSIRGSKFQRSDTELFGEIGLELRYRRLGPKLRHSRIHGQVINATHSNQFWGLPFQEPARTLAVNYPVEIEFHWLQNVSFAWEKAVGYAAGVQVSKSF